MFASNRTIGAFAIAATLSFCQLAAGQETIYIAKDAGKFIRAWGSKGSNNGQLNFPNFLTVGKDGSVYVTGNSRVQKFSATGKFLKNWGTPGTGNYKFLGAYGLAIAPNGDVLVVDKNGGIPQPGRVKRYSANGVYIGEWGTPGNGPGQFRSPTAIAADDKGNVVVSDEQHERLQVYSLTGQFKGQWAIDGVVIPHIAFGPDGTLFYSDPKNHRIVEYDLQGKVLNKWGEFGVGPNKFSTPRGLAISPGGTLYIADSQRRWVQAYRTDGTYITTFGSEGTGKGQFKSMKDVAIAKDGSIYVSDNSRYNIQQFKSAVIEPSKTVTLSGKVTASTLSGSDLQKLTVRVDGKDLGESKRKFFAEVSVQKDGSFTFDGFPSKGKYKILVKGFNKNDLELSPKKHRGKANNSENDLDFELIAK